MTVQALAGDPQPDQVLASGTITKIEPKKGLVGLDVGELWRFRDLIVILTWRDIAVRYKQTALGLAWAVLQPLLMMAIFSLFFGRLAQVPSDGVPYPLFALAALLPWQLFATALTQAANSMINNERLITKVYFPRLIVPLAAILAGVLDFLVAAVFFAGLMGAYGMVPAFQILWAPAFVALALVSALGVGLWLAAINVQYRDVRYTLPFLTQMWMFITPIAYPTSLVPEIWRPIYALNPMVSAVEGLRWSVLGTPAPDLLMTAVSAFVSALILVGGVVYFRQMERGFADKL